MQKFAPTLLPLIFHRHDGSNSIYAKRLRVSFVCFGGYFCYKMLLNV